MLVDHSLKAVVYWMGNIMKVDKKKVLLSLYFSKMARLNEEELHKTLPPAKFIENSNTDTQGFMFLTGRLMVISFRGSQQAKDWLTDFNAWHTDYPYGNRDSTIQVHKGFISAYKSVRGEIHAELSRNRNNWDSILVCGHSLGGALATLCAVDIQYNITNKVECFPSGNPAVGNKAFVKSYNKRVPNTIRTYMKTDIVPFLPPKWFFRKSKGGYAHTAKANRIGPRNPFIGLLVWLKAKTGKFGMDDITNHSIDLYEKYV